MSVSRRTGGGVVEAVDAVDGAVLLCNVYVSGSAGPLTVSCLGEGPKCSQAVCAARGTVQLADANGRPETARTGQLVLTAGPGASLDMPTGHKHMQAQTA